MATITLSEEQVQRLSDEAEYREGGVRTDYSGRGMYGKRCFGIVVRYKSDLEETLEAAGDFAEDFGDPLWDNMGLSYIAYWPWLTVELDD
jgi:hypothetical protein